MKVYFSLVLHIHCWLAMDLPPHVSFPLGWKNLYLRQHRSPEKEKNKDTANQDMAPEASVGSATHNLCFYFIGQSMSHDQAILNKKENV